MRKFISQIKFFLLPVWSAYNFDIEAPIELSSQEALIFLFSYQNICLETDIKLTYRLSKLVEKYHIKKHKLLITQ